MRITRDSVAVLAQVSSATVSRVYNSPDSVSLDLRQRVYEAARTLGYAPNSMAASLRRKGTGTLAFVEFNKSGRPYYWGNFPSFDWFFGRAVRGVQKVIGQSSWQLRFHTVSSRQELEALQSQCDGILAYDVDMYEELSLFEEISIPYVLAHHIDEQDGMCCVRTDNFYGGMLQGRYLKQHGCTKPLYITGYVQSVQPHAKRLEGFLQIFPHAEVLSTTIGLPTSIPSILDEVNALLRTGRIDSLAAVNDLTLYDLLLRTSLDVPLVGYDASPFSTLLASRAASIDIQSGQLYQQATQKLLSMLSSQPEKSTTILPQLITDASNA